ncbi:MAG: hypothetical protein KKC24_23865 [Gammaproteobacteria bacterium]|nr:hypothetical protein [Gammaproteobacteria bacterium]MBU0821886.1 hypothetical protein [Gammaproteobacteria bacterium]MBU0843999.1 hypothetical protein [Gammaproteobacteria bacterium]MBU1842250.1 hypothetical protein [Gammaproteobacteria bacterium]
MSSVLQPTFAAGELSPSTSARTDIARYYTGLKLCRNFMVMPYGGARNRPGTRLVCEVADSTKLNRLIPFQFNDEQTYILQFGDLNMRVIKDGGQIISGGVPYQLAMPYSQFDLPQLNFTQSADLMTFAHPTYKPRELGRLAHDNWVTSEISLAPRIAAPASATATPTAGTGVTQSWRYQVTAVLDDGNSLDESLPVTSNAVTVFADTASATIVWPAVTGATYYIVYKDNAGAGIYGFIGRATALTFTDRNITAVKTDTPPNGADPFVGVGNYPGAVGYYQQRLVFAGSNLSPQTVWMSKTGLFKNFGFSIPNKDDDAITFTIASKEVNRMRHLLGLRKLLGLTSGGEWTFSGGDSGLTAKTIQAAQEGYNGSAIVPPIVVGNSAVYVQARGSRVSSFGYSLNADGFASDDLTIFSTHLFRGFELTSVAYQKIPDSIVWYVRNDGKLLGLTYLPEQQLVGWHWHDTDGFVESIACIPEGQEDALYMVVRRTINGVQKRYVERMATRQVLSIEDAFFVDCGLTYDGRNADTSKKMTLSGGTTWGYPEVVTMTATGHAPFVFAHIGNQYSLKLPLIDKSGEPITETVRVEIVGYTSPSVVTVKLLIICPEVLRNVAISNWARQAKTIAGLDHLEGKTVSILADGSVHPQRVVNGGSVILQEYAGIAHIGLPYDSDLETLDLELKNANETVLDKKIAVTSLTVIVEESRGIFAGKDKHSLYEQKTSRDTYEQPLDPLTGQTEIVISNDWQGKGRVFIRQSDPLPLTVLAVIPEVTVGGR